MKKIQLKIAGLSYSQTRAGAYALILEEENGKRRLPVIIGTSEAQSIAIQLEGLKPYRPLTHDLFISMASSFQIKVIEVNIVKLEEGIFYSEIICKRENTKIKIDSRTSDAIAIALRFKAPIFVPESIMKKAGMLFDEDNSKVSGKSGDSESKDPELNYMDLPDDELTKLMEESVKNEDYETASLIRDELNKRKNKDIE